MYMYMCIRICVYTASSVHVSNAVSINVATNVFLQVLSFPRVSRKEGYLLNLQNNNY